MPGGTVTAISNTFEGTANGTAATTTNTSSGGTAAQGVSLGTGATANFSTTQAAHGTTSMAIAHPSGTSESTYLQWTLGSATATTRVVQRVYVWAASWGTVIEQISRMTSSAGGLGVVGVNVNGNFFVGNSAAASLSIAPNAFPTSQWVRVEMAVTPGTTTTNGRIEAAYYTADSTTAIWSYDSGATVNTGTGPSLRMQIGRTTAASQARTIYFDDLSATDALTSGWIGSVPANVPPTVSAGGTVTSPINAAATLNGSSTDSDGTIASRQWTCTSYPSNASAPTITNATLNVATVTPTVGGVYGFSFSATDNSGATSTDTMTLYATSSSVTATSLTSASGWTGTVGAVQDSDDSTYIESSTASGEKDLVIRLAPMASTSQLTIDVRLALSGAQTNTTTLSLLQGSTVIKSVTIAPTTTMTDYTIALSVAETSTITSFNALDVKIAYTT